MAPIKKAASSRGISPSGRATISRHLAERSIPTTVAAGQNLKDVGLGSLAGRRCIAVPYQFQEISTLVIQIAPARRISFRPHVAATDEETHEGDKAWNRKTGKAKTGKAQRGKVRYRGGSRDAVGAVSLEAQLGLSQGAGATTPAIKSLADAHLGCSGVDGEG
jgi:hypothetical protein